MDLSPLRYSGPGGSAGGIAADAIYTETPVGDIDGVNTTYTTAHAINVIFSIMINHQPLHEGTDFNFTPGASSFEMTSAIDASLAGFPFTIKYA